MAPPETSQDFRIQRYLLKDKNTGVYFGEHITFDEPDFRWYVGVNSYGIDPSPHILGGIDKYFNDILTRDDRIIIHPDYPNLTMPQPWVRFRSRMNETWLHPRNGLEQLHGLIALILSQSETYAYVSSSNEDGSNPDILTFSPQKPPEHLYSVGKVLPVTVDTYDPSSAARLHLTLPA